MPSVLAGLIDGRGSLPHLVDAVLKLIQLPQKIGISATRSDHFGEGQIFRSLQLLDHTKKVAVRRGPLRASREVSSHCRAAL